MLILQRACYSYLMHIWHPFVGNFVTHHRDLHDPKLIETETDVKPSSRLCNRKTWKNMINGAISEMCFSLVLFSWRVTFQPYMENPTKTWAMFMYNLSSNSLNIWNCYQNSMVLD